MPDEQCRMFDSCTRFGLCLHTSYKDCDLFQNSESRNIRNHGKSWGCARRNKMVGERNHSHLIRRADVKPLAFQLRPPRLDTSKIPAPMVQHAYKTQRKHQDRKGLLGVVSYVFSPALAALLPPS